MRSSGLRDGLKTREFFHAGLPIVLAFYVTAAAQAPTFLPLNREPVPRV